VPNLSQIRHEAVSQGAALLWPQVRGGTAKVSAGRTRARSPQGIRVWAAAGQKQKLRYIYGVLERQFRTHFEQAERRPGMTGANLLNILERRMDNVVYRLGFASSRKQARHIVRHGHFDLNGRKTDIPSAMVREGDVVSVRQRSRENEYFLAAKGDLTESTVPRWLSLDTAALSGRVTRVPEREDIDTQVNEQLVVEYYSR